MDGFKKEVAAGIALLDKEIPEWRDRINWDSLDMHSCTSCILGQVFNDYSVGIKYFMRKITDWLTLTYDCGFGIFDFDPSLEEWDKLTKAWIDTGAIGMK